jgi:hypothetical protein
MSMQSEKCKKEKMRIILRFALPSGRVSRDSEAGSETHTLTGE